MSMMVSFVLSFFPRDVLDEILNLIGSVSEGFPSYSYVLCNTLVPWLCSRSHPGIKVIIRGLRGHLLQSVTFLVS